MRKAVLILGLVSLAACIAATTWAAATPGLYVQVIPDKDTSGNMTGNLAARVRVHGLTDAREVVFHLSFPTVYGVDTTASDIRIVAVKPGADVMSIDANNPATPANPADDTPVVFAEGATSTVREVWVVALLTSSANNPKVVCDVVFTCHGRPTTSSIAIDSVQVKDGSLAVLAAPAAFTANATATATGSPVPLFGDFNWSGAIDAGDVTLIIQAWNANAAGHYCPWADIGGGVYDTSTDLSSRLATGNGAMDASDITAIIHAWRRNATGTW
jgi:hypothetical protein